MTASDPLGSVRPADHSRLNVIHRIRFAAAEFRMIPLIYHPGYNITAFGLEKRHPFDSRKYQRIRDALIARGLRRARDFTRPRAVSRSELLRLHDLAYLASLRDPAKLARILEVPIVASLPAWLLDWRILKPMRLATGGTILACRLALEQGVSINLGGGFHHASRSWGGGFCVYGDIPLAAALLHGEGKAEKVLVVDLDAHQGNGTAAALREWPWAFLFDVYQDSLFPDRKEPEDFPRPLPAGTTGTEYLDVVSQYLPAAMDAVGPDLVIYNAGSDPFIHDPLAGFRLSMNDLSERDLLVATLARERKIPIAMVLSGGYSAESWRLHVEGIEVILARFDQ